MWFEGLGCILRRGVAFAAVAFGLWSFFGVFVVSWVSVLGGDLLGVLWRCRRFRCELVSGAWPCGLNPFGFGWSC